MGETYSMMYRPRCCKCGNIAMGRICYSNHANKVVDNPFCGIDFAEVYHETNVLLDEIFGITAMGDWVWVQKWKYTETIPHMPTLPELLEKGVKRR